MLEDRPVVLSRLPGYYVAQAFRVMRHALNDALRDLDLTAPQWGTLACLGESEGRTGAEMARIHCLTPQTMHTILHNLEHMSLIVREADPGNGTVLRVRLTDRGRERLDAAMQRVESVQERMVSRLNDDQRAQLTWMLQQCVESLQEGQREDVPLPCVD